MSSNPYNILIIDDDRGIRDALKEFLNDKGYEVETLGSGEEALDAIKAKSFDVIIVDLKMPGIGGIEVLKSIKNTDPDAVVIIMTGYASLETAIQAIREGAYDYITKPFRLEEISIAIKNACEKVFLRRQYRELIDELRRGGGGNSGKKWLKGGEMRRDKGTEVVEELERLAGLMERGLLTQDEFNLLKKRYF